MSRIWKILFFNSMLLFSCAAQAWVEIYFGTHAGNSQMEEINGGVKYDHSSTIMDFGLSFGSRLRAPLGPFRIGAVGEIAWVGNSLNRKPTNDTAATEYRYEKSRILAGPSLGIKFSDSWSLELEYYAHYSNKVTYSDEKGVNPFRKDDKQSGSGGGLGLSFASGMFKITWMLRELKLTASDLGGYKDVDPLPTFDPLISKEAAVTFGLDF
jgi:hypothetical protein